MTRITFIQLTSFYYNKFFSKGHTTVQLLIHFQPFILNIVFSNIHSYISFHTISRHKTLTYLKKDTFHHKSQPFSSGKNNLLRYLKTLICSPYLSEQSSIEKPFLTIYILFVANIYQNRFH